MAYFLSVMSASVSEVGEHLFIRSVDLLDNWHPHLRVCRQGRIFFRRDFSVDDNYFAERMRESFTCAQFQVA